MTEDLLELLENVNSVTMYVSAGETGMSYLEVCALKTGAVSEYRSISMATCVSNALHAVKGK